MSGLHPFDRAIALEPLGEDRFAGRTDPAWANRVGPYGGITAATLLNAAWLHPRRLGEPVSLTVHYAAPVADGAFEVHARAVRTNRSTQHWWIVLQQDGAVAATATALFAIRRTTWAAPERPMPAVPAAVAVPPAAPRTAVAWPARYQLRFVEGGWPELDEAHPQPDSQTTVWIRDEPPRPLDACALASMIDCFYPRVYRRRQRLVPAGTVSMTTHFHAGADALARQGAQPLLGCARGLRFERGYFDQRAELWGADGTLLASGMQSVYFNDGG